MTLQQMEYIVALNKYRHFVGAADSCGVTQPSLSAMIQKLEDELGVKIFNRDNKQVSPTSIGEKIIQQAQTTLNESKRIKEVVLDEMASMSGKLHLGIIPTVDAYIAPLFIHHFKQSYPDVSLYISEMKTKTLIHELEFGNIDIGIAAMPPDCVSILDIPLYKERFVAYYANGSKNIDASLTSTGLASEQLWVLEEGHCINRQPFSFCKAKELGNHIYEAGSIDTLIRIVDTNGGYTIIPELHLPFLSDKQRENVREIETPDAERQISILIKEDFVRERMVNAVVDTIKKIVPHRMVNERLHKFNVKL